MNRILLYFIDEETLKLEPIIAGGFAVFMYRLFKLYDTDEKLAILEREIASSNKYEILRKFQELNHGDIDFWFDENHFIWDEYPGLCTGEDKINTKHFKLGRQTKATIWATTYVDQKDLSRFMPIQLINRKIESLELLLDNFDFVNCCIAIIGDSFVFKDGFEESYAKFEVVANKDLNTASFNSKLYTCIRAFKYALRYQLDFSEEYMKFALQIFLKSVSDLDTVVNLSNRTKDQSKVFLKKVFADAEQESEKSLILEMISSLESDESLGSGALFNQKPDVTITNKITMMRALFSSFESFTKMKYFKHEYYPYFLETQIPQIEFCVKRKLDPVVNKTKRK